MAKKIIKIKKGSVPWLFAIAILPILVAVLGQFNIIDLSSQQASILTIFMGIFILGELGFSLSKKGMKLGKKPIRIFGLIVVLVAFISAILNLIGIQVQQLSTIQGSVGILVIIYLIMVAFTD